MKSFPRCGGSLPPPRVMKHELTDVDTESAPTCCPIRSSLDARITIDRTHETEQNSWSKRTRGVPMATVFRSQKRSRSAGKGGRKCGRGWRMKRNMKQSSEDQLCWSCFLISVFLIYTILHKAAWQWCMCLLALVHTPCIQTRTQPHRRTYIMQIISFSHPFSLSHARHQSPHIKSQFEPRFLCLKCKFFGRLPQKKGIYMYNMQLFTLRQSIVSISASIKSSQRQTAGASAIEMLFFFFFFWMILIPMQACWLFRHTNCKCTVYAVCVYWGEENSHFTANYNNVQIDLFCSFIGLKFKKQRGHAACN